MVWGAGGHALVVADAILSKNEDVCGFIDTVNPVHVGDRVNDLPLWGSLEEAACHSRHESIEIAIGFGHCAARSRLLKRLDELGFAIKTVVHAHAIVSSRASIGRGVYIAPNAVVEANCSIGDGVIVNTNSAICHECIIGEAVSICPGVNVGGKTRIGEASWIGIGSTLIDKVTVGRCCYIGAGSVVVKDIPCQMMAYGVPARVIHKMESEF